MNKHILISILASCIFPFVVIAQKQIIEVSGSMPEAVEMMQLSLEESLGAEPVTRALKLHYFNDESKKETSEMVWSREYSKTTSIYPLWRDSRPYLDSRIVHASYRKELLVVIFRLDSRNYNRGEIFPWPPNYFTYLKDWDGFDYLMRVFSKNNQGEWKVDHSAFLRTFFIDTLNCQLSKIEIIDESTYEISYGNERGVKSDEADKSRDEILVKRLRFDTEKKLLTAYYSKYDDYVYVNRSYWWHGFDEFDQYASSDKSILTVMKDQKEHVQTLGVTNHVLKYKGR